MCIHARSGDHEVSQISTRMSMEVSKKVSKLGYFHLFTGCFYQPTFKKG